jgi:membrane-associated phospholipid phosphatase
MSIAIAAVLFPLDGPISTTLTGWYRSGSLGGDIRRELEMLQQFGGLSSLILTALIVWAAAPGRRALLPALAAACGLTWLVVQAFKMLVGRPRPSLGDPGLLLGPFGAYPLPDVTPPGVYHAWEFWEPISSRLWSMPSSHTSAAAALAVWLAWAFPGLRWIGVVLVGVVGLTRVLTGAHYLGDVVVGGALGFAVAHWAVYRFGPTVPGTVRPHVP